MRIALSSLLITLTGASLVGCWQADRLLGSVGNASIDAGDPFGAPHLIQELFDPSVEREDPSMTGDGLELYFREVRGTDDWIVVSKRASPGDPWGAPTAIAELSADGFRDGGPEVSEDGLTIWFASDRPGTVLNTDIWVATRPSRSAPWGVPVDPVELNSTEWESDPDVPPDQLSILYTSAREAGINYIFASQRESTSQKWNAPAPAAWSEGLFPAWDPCISDRGLTLFFASKRDGAPATDLGDIFVATRPSVGMPFGPRMPVTELNDPDATDQDPWVTTDGRHIFFTSARGGNNQLYEAWRER
jgi:Tol biopolymer transport system component